MSGDHTKSAPKTPPGTVVRERLNVKRSSWEVWPRRDTVIFVIRFTCYVSRFTNNGLLRQADFFSILLDSLS